MSVLSWDVGIKNLAYCLLSAEGTIERWGVIDLRESLPVAPVCVALCGNGKECKNAAKWGTAKGPKCAVHCRTGGEYLTSTVRPTPCAGRIKKTGMRCGVPGVRWREGDQFYCGRHKSDGAVRFRQPKCKRIPILDMGLAIARALEGLEGALQVDTVIIENQPTLRNPVIKSVQMMLYQWFVIRGIVDRERTGSTIKDIQNYNATNKLKGYAKGGGGYKGRKSASVELARKYVGEEGEWSQFFREHSKKDDLADSLLQGLHFLGIRIPEV